MQHARLTSSDMTGVNLDRAVARKAVANNVNLTGASLEQTNLNNARRGQSIFDNATISYAGFIRVEASRAGFDGAQIAQSDFYGADLRRAFRRRHSAGQPVLAGQHR